MITLLTYHHSADDAKTDNHSSTLALKVIVGVTTDDIDTFERLFAEKLALGHTALNILIDLSEWQVRDSSLLAGWQERLWGVKNVQSMGRIAIVGHSQSKSRWLKAVILLEAMAVRRLNPNAEERYFDVKDLDKAWAFVKGKN